MAPVKRLLAAPVAFASYVLGWWGIEHGTGFIGATLPFLWILAYYGVFWGGWFAIPLLGIGATIARPLLPDRLARWVGLWFIGWLLAWGGVLAALAWLGPPAGFAAQAA